jgi:hypothetical protein
VIFHISGTLKHSQIAAVEWNREAIARVKAGVDVYGEPGCPRLFMCSADGLCWYHVGAVPQHGNAVVTYFERTMQEIEELHD